MNATARLFHSEDHVMLDRLATNFKPQPLWKGDVQIGTIESVRREGDYLVGEIYLNQPLAAS
jgi:hypothetical protein